MSELEISHLSLEYVRIRVQATVDGVDRNPTTDTVKVAFPALNADPADWKDASWETDADGHHFARCLVGPSGTVELAKGRYAAWIQVDDNPETVVRAAGQVKVT